MEDEPERPLGMSRKHCVPNWDLYRQQLLPHIMEVETDRRAVYALKAIGSGETDWASSAPASSLIDFHLTLF